MGASIPVSNERGESFEGIESSQIVQSGGICSQVEADGGRKETRRIRRETVGVAVGDKRCKVAQGVDLEMCWALYWLSQFCLPRLRHWLGHCRHSIKVYSRLLGVPEHPDGNQQSSSMVTRQAQISGLKADLQSDTLSRCGYSHPDLRLVRTITTFFSEPWNVPKGFPQFPEASFCHKSEME